MTHKSNIQQHDIFKTVPPVPPSALPLPLPVPVGLALPLPLPVPVGLKVTIHSNK
jgi:hypothetical protein